jgi:tetratricopeptide (TPR) repeat protein
MAPEDHSDSSSIPSVAGAPAAGNPPPPGKQSLKSLSKWLLLAAGVSLLAYPALRRSPTPNRAPAAGFPAELNRSLEYYQTGQYPEAIVAAKEALKLNPNSEAAYNNIAVSYAAMKMWDEANRNIHEALRIRPDFELAQNNLAWFQKAQQGGIPESKSAADHVNLSVQHCQAGRYNDCIAEAREAITLKPDYAEAYNNIAAGYIGLQDWDEAIKNAQEALRINPNFTLARNNLSLALRTKASGRASGK